MEEGLHFFLGIEQAIVHVHVDDQRAVFHLLTGNAQSFFVILFIDQAKKLARTRHITSFTYIDELHFFRLFEQLQARDTEIFGCGTRNMGLCAFHQRDILGYVCLGSTTASSYDIHQTFIDILLHFPCHILRCLVVFTQAVRKSGIRISTDIIRRTTSQLLQERLQLLGTERAIQANGENRCMLYGSQKSIQCLAGQGTSSRIGHRDGKHQRNLPTDFFHCFHSCINSSLGIERIEDRFYQDGIYPTLKQGFHLFLIGIRQLIESNGTESRVVHIGTHGASLVGRSYRACHKTRLLRILGCIFIRQFTGKLGCSQVDFPTIVLHMIIRHRNALCIEGIGLDDIRPCFQILAMDVTDDIGSRQTQQVVTLHLSGLLHKTIPTKFLFREIIFLYHGSQRSIQYQDALTNQLLYCFHNHQCLNMRSISRRSSFSLMD